MCINLTTSPTSTGNGSNSSSKPKGRNSNRTDLLHTVLLNGDDDDCKALTPILPDNDDDDVYQHNYHRHAHSTTARLRKRPRLADCAEYWAKRQTGSSNYSEESTLVMPEPDSTSLMNSKEEDEVSLLEMKAAKKQSTLNSSTNQSQPEQTPNRSKMPFSLLLHMTQFEPWQITVKVQPDRRTLEVRGTKEIHQNSPTPMVSASSDEGAADKADDRKSPADSYSATSGDFERLEYVKHLKVPANVALEALSCTLDQNGWLRVEEPTREDDITSTITSPDQSAQWTEPRLIPVKVIIRKEKER